MNDMHRPRIDPDLPQPTPVAWRMATGSPTIAATPSRARPTGLRPASPPVSLMLRPAVRFCLAPALLAVAVLPALAADLLPHEGNYVVRLGSSLSAPQVGTARQLLGLDCHVWHLERDVITDIPLGAGLRLTSTSELRGAEPRDGTVFNYQLKREQNGREFAISGRVTVGKNGARADLVLPSRPVTYDLPGGVVLPVAAFAQAIDALKGGADSFSFAMFDAELTSDALQVDGKIVPADALRPPRPEGSKLPGGTAWPVEITFNRAGGRQLFTVLLLLHEGGALDRLTISTGLLTASADLVAFKPLPRPNCPVS